MPVGCGHLAERVLLGLNPVVCYHGDQRFLEIVGHPAGGIFVCGRDFPGHSAYSSIRKAIVKGILATGVEASETWEG